MKAVGTEQAAECLGMSTRALESWLREIGPMDEQGRPRYRMTPKHGKRLFSEKDIERLWETLPTGKDGPEGLRSIPQDKLRNRRTGMSEGRTGGRKSLKAQDILESRLLAISGKSKGA